VTEDIRQEKINIEKMIDAKIKFDNKFLEKEKNDTLSQIKKKFLSSPSKGV
jgi:hypothetical protein